MTWKIDPNAPEPHQCFQTFTESGYTYQCSPLTSSFWDDGTKGTKIDPMAPVKVPFSDGMILIPFASGIQSDSPLKVSKSGHMFYEKLTASLFINPNTDQ